MRKPERLRGNNAIRGVGQGKHENIHLRMNRSRWS
jgi:hypothetical protein